MPEKEIPLQKKVQLDTAVPQGLRRIGGVLYKQTQLGPSNSNNEPVAIRLEKIEQYNLSIRRFSPSPNGHSPEP